MTRRALGLISAFTLLGLPLAALPGDAEACGGTFCDQGPMNMPVDQTGENILFVLAEDHTEAHIQIQYDPETDAEKFSWIVPVTSVPDFTVGSQQLFINVLNATVPVYGFVNQFEPCDYGGDGGYYDDSCSGSSGAGSSASGGGEGTGGDDGGTTGDAPKVLLRTTVGAFDVVVLEGANAAVVMDWLGMNGYYQDPNAEPILQEYIDDGYVFAAFKLVQGAEVDEIHPITISYAGNEPCVPIKLTRIAAKPDMDIRTFFLSANRVGPSNYHHVVINEAQLDWPMFASNYKEVVTLAVDEEPSNGHAWVTEYAGPSEIVDQTGLFSELWDHTVFVDLKPIDVVDQLIAQGLMECVDNECTYNHPLVQGILYAFLPVPDGIPEGDFYSCLECYEGSIDVDAYIPELLAQALLERVIEPGAHAVEILTTWPTLSRLYTTLSPQEMTQDPFFHQNADLPGVDLTQTTATQFFPCRGGSSWNLPGGHKVPGAGQTWPMMPAEMPYAERVEMIPPAGAPQVEVDNAQLIDMLLQMLLIQMAPEPRACDSASASASDSSSDSSSSSDTGATGGGFDGDGAACACRSDASDPVVAGLMLFLAGGFLRRRRA